MPNEFLDIDLLNLEKEWVQQPKKYYIWGKRLSKAKKKLEKSKVSLDLIKSEIDSMIRSDPEKHGLVKATEAAISNAVLQNEEYKKAMDRHIRLKYKVDILQTAVNAMIQRKEALESAVRLHGQSYFSIPKANSITKETVDSMLEEGRKNRRKSK